MQHVSTRKRRPPFVHLTTSRHVKIIPRSTIMIRTTYMLAGLLTAMAAWLIYHGSQREQQPKEVEVLAHRLEEAWADHHTRV